MPVNVVVAGASGLVGRAIVALLAAQPQIATTALVRKPGTSGAHGPVQERVFSFAEPLDFSLLGTPALPCDVLLCCLGTTQRTAGSRAAFRHVDYAIPLALARAVLTQKSHAMIGLVSSVGADRPTGFYLETKAALESELRRSAVNLVIARPSLLLGERAESRPLEAMAQRFMPPLLRGLGGLPFGVGRSLVPYVPVAATDVAAALVAACVTAPRPGQRILVGADFRI